MVSGEWPVDAADRADAPFVILNKVRNLRRSCTPRGRPDIASFAAGERFAFYNPALPTPVRT